MTRKPPALVAGTLAVALLFFGSRWASYLTVAPPIYPADVLLLAAVVQYVLSQRRLGAPTRVGRHLPVLGLLLGWVVLRFVASPLALTIDGLRDAAPYFYVVAGLLAAHSCCRVPEQARANTARLLVWALGLHACWYVVSGAVPSLPAVLPALSGPVHVLTSRPDVDSAFAGVFAGYLLAQLIVGQTRRPLGSVVMIGVCALGIALGHSRAGFIGAGLAVAFALIAAMLTPGVKPRQMVASVLLPVVFVGVAFYLPHTTIGARLGGTFGASAASGSAAAGAAGTTSAREDAWRNLYGWISQDTGRTVAGVGFGPNFMADSHTTLLLIGSDSQDAEALRSPHDYWLGTMARLGLIGAVLALLAAATALARVWRVRRAVYRDPLLMIGCLTVIALFVPASLGVVLESPFGALPFWWCVGIVAAGARRDDPDQELAELTRPATASRR